MVYIVFGFRVVNVFFLNLLIGQESGALMKQLGVIFNAIIALVTFVGCVNRWVRDSVSCVPETAREREAAAGSVRRRGSERGW